MPTQATINVLISQPPPLNISVGQPANIRPQISQPVPIQTEQVIAPIKADSNIIGVKGDPGTNATISVGSVVTGDAGSSVSISNSGTPTEAVLDFVIPKGDLGETGASITSVAIDGNNIVFTKDDESIVTLVDAMLALKGDTGETGASIISAEFVGDDLVFTKDDSTTVTLADAKVALKGDQGIQGIQGDPGEKVELQKTETYIQWKLIGDEEWINLVALIDLKGDIGETGLTGETGEDGREIELQKSATHIQWRYAGDASWTDLVALADLKGADGAGVPTGGTTGQVLKKKSNTDYDTEFGDLVAVSVTTKGDLQTHNATVPDRLAVGTDGQILAADSAQGNGLKWIDPNDQNLSDFVTKTGEETLTNKTIVKPYLSANSYIEYNSTSETIDFVIT